MTSEEVWRDEKLLSSHVLSKFLFCAMLILSGVAS